MTLVLYVCYILGILFSLLMVTSVSPMNAVICSILVFYCVSTIYMLIGLDFLGTIPIIVYVGAIAVSLLSVVMLVDLRRIGVRRGELSLLPVLILFLSFIQVFLFMEYSASTTENVHLSGLQHDYMLGRSLDDASRRQILLSVGVSLYEYHPSLLLLAGVLLFAALVGSIYLTNYKKGFKERRQYNQLSRRKHIYTAYVSGETVIPKRILFLEKQRHREWARQFLIKAYLAAGLAPPSVLHDKYSFLVFHLKMSQMKPQPLCSPADLPCEMCKKYTPFFPFFHNGKKRKKSKTRSKTRRVNRCVF